MKMVKHYSNKLEIASYLLKISSILVAIFLPLGPINKSILKWVVQHLPSNTNENILLTTGYGWMVLFTLFTILIYVANMLMFWEKASTYKVSIFLYKMMLFFILFLISSFEGFVLTNLSMEIRDFCIISFLNWLVIFILVNFPEIFISKYFYF